MLDNLLSNAIKFTKDEINLSLEGKDKNIELIIKDNGDGIGEKDMPHIWESFYQGDESRNKEGNFSIGLGLSFVQQILDYNGWTAKLPVKLEMEPSLKSKFINKK